MRRPAHEAPPNDEPDLADRALRRAKREDTALALPAFGIVLLVSPVLDVVSGETHVLGVPLAFLYVFLTWAGGILVTWGLARRLAGARRGD